MKFTPRDYQREAIEAICTSLKKSPRATGVMACGTGKTLVALWVSEKLQAKTIVVFMPSLMLIKQTIETWTEQTKWFNYSYMAVCCDDKLLDDDIIEIDAKECCFDVCINAEQVRAFMSNDKGVKIVFCTYQSSNIIPKDIKFDLAIFDEAHKTAHKDMGAFRYALYDDNVSIKKRLFLTATPRHYQLKGRTTHLEYSMSNEEIYGPIVYRLDFAQAIKKGIICDYKVLITIMNDDIVLEGCANKLINDHGRAFNMQMMAHVIAIKQTIDKYPIKRAVAFHRTIKDTKEFTRTALHLKDLKCTILDISSKMNSEDRAHTMKTFEYSSKAIISNARCLSEGVDIPSIDLVAFLSPKKSKIDIIQAIGRVMRNAPGKKYGYILLPVYVSEKIHAFNDLTDRSEYRYIMEIINSLREYDTDLQQQISDRFLDKGEYGERIKTKIEFVNADINSDELAQAIDIDILESFKDDWDVRFEEAKKWYEKNGNWVFKEARTKHNRVRGWVQWQRKHYKDGLLSKERIDKLRSINFVFDAKEARDEEKLSELMKIFDKHGLISLYKDYKTLENWVWYMGTKIRKGEHSSIIERLVNYIKKFPGGAEYLDERRSTHSKKIDEYLYYLIDYHKKYGHIDVKYTENDHVAKWLHRLQTGGFKNLSKSTRKKLDDMGYVHTNKDVKKYADEWNRKYKELVEYKKLRGNLVFHKNEKEYGELNRWVTRQRCKYIYNKCANLTIEQRQKLKDIGLFKHVRENQKRGNGKKVKK
jgi:predicted helicase